MKKGKRFRVVTNKGYCLFEVSSALQKSLRRGLERDSLYWAYELDSSGYHKYLWKRLIIISVEDIGPANPMACGIVRGFRESYLEMKQAESKDLFLFVAGAVLFLARSEKSRLYDWAKCIAECTHLHRSLGIPEYALDMHTQRGRRNGKTIEDFFATGCKLHPHIVEPGENEFMEEFRKLLCDLGPQDRSRIETEKILPIDHPDRCGMPRSLNSDDSQGELFPEL